MQDVSEETLQRLRRENIQSQAYCQHLQRQQAFRASCWAMTRSAVAGSGGWAAPAAAALAPAPARAPVFMPNPIQLERFQLEQQERDAQERVQAVQEQAVWDMRKSCFWDPPWVEATSYDTATYLRCVYPAALSTAEAIAAAQRNAWQQKQQCYETQGEHQLWQQEELLRQLNSPRPR